MENRSSNIYLGDEAREKLMRGVDAVADAVKLTLGAAGANAVLESGMMPGHLVTNDGVSIAQMALLTDPVENMGANLIKEVASRSDKEGGDGTTTTTVLTQAILHAGMAAEGNPMDIKRSLDECLPLIIASIDAQKKEITPSEVGKVAAVSGENEAMGALFQEIYEKIGKDGIVELDNSNLPETFYEISEGVRLRNTGFFGAYSTTEPGKAVYKRPLILISKERIASTDDIEPILAAVKQTGKNELVIFADDIDMAVASRLAYTHLNGGFKTLLIKAPTLWKDLITEDFAKITGATVVNNAEGITFKTLRMTHLGTCEKLICTKDETRIIGIKDISEHIATLKEEGSDESKLRMAWLDTKVATLKLGANSESELSYVRLKAEDSRNASFQALQSGVVAGGGVALLNAATSLPETVGGTILKKSLAAPMLQIMANAGFEYSKPIAGLGVGENPSLGFNAKTCEIVDMWEAGILDAAAVTKNAITNAISVAGTVLTTRIVVIIPQEIKDAASKQMPSV